MSRKCWKKAQPGEYAHFCMNEEGRIEHRWDVSGKKRGEWMRKGKLCFCGQAKHPGARPSAAKPLYMSPFRVLWTHIPKSGWRVA